MFVTKHKTRNTTNTIHNSKVTLMMYETTQNKKRSLNKSLDFYDILIVDCRMHVLRYAVTWNQLVLLWVRLGFFFIFLLACYSFNRIRLIGHLQGASSWCRNLLRNHNRHCRDGFEDFGEICKYYYNIFLFYYIYIVNSALLLNNRVTQIK